MAAIAQPLYMPESHVELAQLPIYEQLIEKTIGDHTYLLQSDEKCRNYIVMLGDQAFPMTWDQILRYSADNQAFPVSSGYDFKGEFYSKGKRLTNLVARLESDKVKLSELGSAASSEPKVVTEQIEVVDWRATLSIVFKVAITVYLISFISFWIFTL